MRFSGRYEMKKYKLTLIASLLGIFSQAVATNLIALIFVPLMSLYGLSFVHLGVLVGVNFGLQILTDIVFAPLIDKIGYKKLILPACAFASLGLLLLGAVPLFSEYAFYVMLAATGIFAAACGLTEILLSPMVTAMDSDRGRYVSLLHSAYAWGQVITIILTTGLLALLGSERWYFIPVMWALLPAVCFFMFVRAPFPPAIPEQKRTRTGTVMRSPVFVLLLTAIFFGAAAEVTMNQWASVFAEKALGMDKAAGDLLCMCGFAAAMGAGRLLYSIKGGGKNLSRILFFSAVGAFACYVTAALSPNNAVCTAAFILCGLCTALLWPGTALIASDSFPAAGSWLYASLAVFGDTGAAVIPLITGTMADAFGEGAGAGLAAALGVSAEQGGLRLALLVSAAVPMLCALSHYVLAKVRSGGKHRGGTGSADGYDTAP